MNKSIITFFGPPGAGKGVLSQLICTQVPHLKHVSLGNVCRKYAEEKSELGEKIYSLISQGNLVTLDIIEEIVKKVLDDFINDSKYQILIFDGYPRNLTQFESFFSISTKYYSDIMNKNYYIMLFQAKKKILKDRLLKRYVCFNSACAKIYSFLNNNYIEFCDSCNHRIIKRDDDDISIIDKRINSYFDEEEKVVDYIKKQMNIKYLFLDSSQSTKNLYENMYDYFYDQKLFPEIKA